MCTAVSFKPKSHYFGRNLDLDISHNEKVIIVPRKFTLHFEGVPDYLNHYAMIGTGIIADNYPLYYDAVNECGLCAAGLNFPEFAKYGEKKDGYDNIAHYELILWILAQCKTVKEAKGLLARANIVNHRFRSDMPAAQLHFLIADDSGAITVEPLENGLKIYDNPVGVLTNAPTFDYHMLNLANYMGVGAATPENNFSDKISLSPYSLGFGMYGIPGDLSSASRFVKCSFTGLNAVGFENEAENVGQFFHILGSVEQQSGCVETPSGTLEKTVYSSCCNAHTGVYYYTTYNNRQITAVDMHRENLNGCMLISYKHITEQNILYQN